jgi:hypothetical protein
VPEGRRFAFVGLSSASARRTRVLRRARWSRALEPHWERDAFGTIAWGSSCCGRGSPSALTTRRPNPGRDRRIAGSVGCRLRRTARKIYALNPLAVARYGERHSLARGKPDRVDTDVPASAAERLSRCDSRNTRGTARTLASANWTTVTLLQVRARRF